MINGNPADDQDTQHHDREHHSRAPHAERHHGIERDFHGFDDHAVPYGSKLANGALGAFCFSFACTWLGCAEAGAPFLALRDSWEGIFNFLPMVNLPGLLMLFSAMMAVAVVLNNQS